MSSKISMVGIIKDHMGTLYNAKTGKKYGDVFLFFILPLMITIFFGWLSPLMNTTAITLGMIIFALFVPAGFVISGLIESMQNDEELVVNLMKQTKASISFLIFISVLGLLAILVFSVVPEDIYAVKVLLSCIVYYLMLVFGLTILMILKRTYGLSIYLLNKN